MIYKDNIALGTVFLDTLPRVNIMNLRGKHRQCPSNAANKHNVVIGRQVKAQQST